MLIPVKCFSCGKVLANKYDFYVSDVKKQKLNNNIDLDKVTYLTKDFMEKTPEGEALDKLGLTKYCCRRHMLTHVDIE
jgi:DNA-directed RNA polymerase I, II, and III subunit RPABC5|tara:strand:- start:5106 stop:5339 length:234 start_codon:yes stop_codon:yes gene_type:complete